MARGRIHQHPEDRAPQADEDCDVNALVLAQQRRDDQRRQRVRKKQRPDLVANRPVIECRPASPLPPAGAPASSRTSARPASSGKSLRMIDPELRQRREKDQQGEQELLGLLRSDAFGLRAGAIKNQAGQTRAGKPGKSTSWPARWPPGSAEIRCWPGGGGSCRTQTPSSPADSSSEKPARPMGPPYYRFRPITKMTQERLAGHLILASAPLLHRRAASRRRRSDAAGKHE